MINWMWLNTKLVNIIKSWMLEFQWCFGFSRFRPKMNFFFIFVLFFVFVPKNLFALGRKCYVRNWTKTKFCDRGTDDFRFRFRPKIEFSFTAENEKCIFGRPLYTSNCFRLHPMIFRHWTIPVPGSLQVPWKISFTLYFWHKSSIIIIVVVVA